MADRRRELPSVDRLLQRADVRQLLATWPRPVIVAAAREAVGRARAARSEPPEDWGAEVAAIARDRQAPSLHSVINATGVVLHTNLGRSPLATSAIDAMVAIATGYSNLELDVATGSRGSRLDHAGSMLASIAGTEDALLVNNAAGALVLTLNALASGREVIISRGELIEIGGSFRIPDILEKSGAKLVEVGTTNRTHLSDYDKAVTDQTGAILVVHRSNFEMSGFVTSPLLDEVASLAAAKRIPLIADVGSGLLLDLAEFGLTGEPLVPETARTADLTIFSGDKLLGGPQAGCVVGTKTLIGRLKKNPFARALRADKLTIAALDATLKLYQDRSVALSTVPVLRMLTASPSELELRALRLAGMIDRASAPVTMSGLSAVGGGSFPAAQLATTLVALDPGADGANALALKLRLGNPSILTRIENDRVLLDPRTIPEPDLERVAQAIAEAIAEQ